MNLTKGIQKSLGPGIVLAGAAIGGSHLLSSTTAGARFGFSLVGLLYGCFLERKIQIISLGFINLKIKNN